MIRNPADGTVTEPPKPEPIKPPEREITGLTDEGLRLEESRKWLKQYGNNGERK